MSADRPNAALAALALAAVAACGGGAAGGEGNIPSPVVKAIDPAFGYAAAAVAVTITGDNFLARPEGGTLDTRHRAWLDGIELADVTWIDAHTLHATVPAGMASGAKTLRVENAYGRRGSLEAAFEVLVPAGLAASVTAGRDQAVVLQEIPVTLTVANGAGGGAATARITRVEPGASVTAGTASCTAVTPSLPVTIAAGQSVELRWTCRATAPATLTLGAEIAGEEVVSGGALSAVATTDAVDVQAPAALRATLALTGISPPAVVNVGQPLSVTVTVTNTGAAPATVTGVTPAPSPGGRAACDVPVPTPPVDLAGGASAPFAFTCTPSSTGGLSLGAQVAGRDVLANAPLTASAAPAALTVEYPAAPVAILAAAPGNPTVPGGPLVADVGQPVQVVFTVAAGGSATAGLTGVTATPAPAAICGAVAPAAPQAIPAGQSAQFTWTCTPAAAGPLNLSGTARGTDANSGLPITATPAAAAAVTVQTPAHLTVTAFQAPAAVDVGQGAAVSLTLLNAGGAAARIRAVVPAPSGASGLGCSAPQPPASAAAPQIVAGGGTAVFTWTCTGTAAGAYSLGATVAAADANWAAVDPAPAVQPRPLAVEAPAALAVVAFTSSRPSVDRDEVATITLRLRNTGDAAADVTSVAPGSTPEGMSCGPVSPAVPIRIAGGVTADFTWPCHAATAGAYALTAEVTATDGNVPSRAVTATASGLGLPVQAPAALTAALAREPASIEIGDDVTVRLTLTNAAGQGSARVTAIAPLSSAPAAACPAAPAEALPRVIAGGGSSTFTWACTGAARGTPTLDAQVTAVAVDGGAALVTPVDGVGVTVLAPAALSVVRLEAPASATVGRAFAVSLTLRNGGDVAAQVTAVSPTPGTPGLACTAATPAASAASPQVVAPSESITFTWTCTGAAAGSYSLGASVAGTGAPTVTPSPLVVVPSLSAAVSADPASIGVGERVSLRLTVTNAAGAAGAQVTAITPSSSSGAVACPDPPAGLPVTIAGGGTATFEWSCTGEAGGTASVGATVAAGTAQTISATPTTVEVGTMAGVPLSGTLAGSPSTLPASTGGTVTLWLTLRNPGPTPVHLAAGAVTAVVGGDGVEFSCLDPPVTPLDIAAGATLGTPITWTCETAGGPVDARPTLGARVAARDAGGRDAGATITGTPVRLR